MKRILGVLTILTVLSAAAVASPLLVTGSDGNLSFAALFANLGSGVHLLHGIDWGLVDSAYVAGTGNASISGEPLIQNGGGPCSGFRRRVNFLRVQNR